MLLSWLEIKDQNPRDSWYASDKSRMARELYR